MLTSIGGLSPLQQFIDETDCRQERDVGMESRVQAASTHYDS